MRLPTPGVQSGLVFVACRQQKCPKQVLCCSDTVLYFAHRC